MNQNNFLNNVINQDDLNRQAYQKIMRTKRLIVICNSWNIGYISFLVLFIISLVLLVYLSCLMTDELNKDSSFVIPVEFWEFLLYPILDFIFLEITGFVLLMKTKKLKEQYPEKIRNLPILYLVGLFLLVPSFVAAILLISTCKKINKEIDAQLCVRNYD